MRLRSGYITKERSLSTRVARPFPAPFSRSEFPARSPCQPLLGGTALTAVSRDALSHCLDSVKICRDTLSWLT